MRMEGWADKHLANPVKVREEAAVTSFRLGRFQPSADGRAGL